MAFTEQQFKAQQVQLKELEGESSRLNAQFAQQVKEVGLTPKEIADGLTALKKILTPDLRQYWDETQPAAEQDEAVHAAGRPLAATKDTLEPRL